MTFDVARIGVDHDNVHLMFAFIQPDDATVTPIVRLVLPHAFAAELAILIAAAAERGSDVGAKTLAGKRPDDIILDHETDEEK